MIKKLIIFFFLLVSLLGADVIFHDNFNRSNGEVGNSWTNVGPDVNATIESGIMKIEAGFNRGVSRSFTTIESGIYYIQYDWKFSDSDWFVSSFPTDIPVHLMWENTGAIYKDATGGFFNPTLIGQVSASNWLTVKWKVDLDNDIYSLWLGDNQVAEDITGNAVILFNSFNFRTANGSSGTQYVDNFLIFDNTAPTIPTGLRAVANVNNIILNWDESDNQDFITYRIYRSTSSPATEFLAEVAGSQNEYIDTTAEANTDYYYRIKAVSMNTIESSYSAEVYSHLIPVPVLSPADYELNLRLANKKDTINFNLLNSGSYPLNYTLSGTDEFAPVDQLIEISGFEPMGIYEGHTYYKSNSRMSWHAAKSLCEEKGGHLVTISDHAENTFVYQNTSPSCWIGFTDENSEGNWEWITGEAVTFTYWLPNEPNNVNNEDYAHMGHTSPYDKWNDNSSTTTNNSYAVLEFDYLFPPSILKFNQSSGIINTGDSNAFTVSIDASELQDGIYETSIKLEVESITQAFYYPITINVDFNPPLQVTGLSYDSNNTDANQIGISWDANASSDQVSAYHIFRKGRDEANWRLMANVPHTQLSYIDNDFTPIDSTYVYYSVSAEDWVGNISVLSDSVTASLERYLAPESLQITNIEDRDIQLTWTPVTHTITGLLGTPSCYIIYKSQTSSPISEYDFLAVSFTPEYVHNWALYFQPENKLFYIVTAYGGDMQRLNQILSRKEGWKRGELEDMLQNMESED